MAYNSRGMVVSCREVGYQEVDKKQRSTQKILIAVDFAPLDASNLLVAKSFNVSKNSIVGFKFYKSVPGSQIFFHL